MTSDEKALIDAKREAFMAGWKEARPLTTYHETLAKELAEKAYPYPPPPVVWREVKDCEGAPWRIRDGFVEVYIEGAWRRRHWMTPDFILALARCVTEPMLRAEEVRDA